MSTVFSDSLPDQRVVSFQQKRFTIANATVAAECSPTAVVLTTLAGQVLYANRVFMEIFGLPSIESVVNLDLAEACKAQVDFHFLSKLAKDGQPQQRTLQLTCNGQPMTLLCSATRVAAESDYPKWLSISLTPAGEQSVPSTMPSANDAILERLIGRHGMWSITTAEDVDLRQTILAASPGFCAMMRWSHLVEPQQLREWLRVIHRDDRNRVLNAITQLATHGGEYTLQYRLQTSATDHIIQSTACATARDGLVTLITGVERDITDTAVRGEAERRQFRLLRALSDCVEIPAFALDAHGQLLWFNTPFVGFLRPLELTVTLGQPLEHAFPDNSLRRRLRRNLRRALRGEQRVEEVLLDIGGVGRRCDFNFNPVRDDTGTVVAVMTTVTEILGSRHAIP
jgi:PAS domain-containing protein